MRVVVVGCNGGIGRHVSQEVNKGAFTLWNVAHEVVPDDPFGTDAVVCCNGDPRVFSFNYDAAARWLPFASKLFICMSGGGIGGPPSIDLEPDYVASKAALAALVEYAALKWPHRQFFCVAPGLTATKMSGYKGADPRVPAAFIVKLLSGKYGHLSGSLLAAQRDDLDTMKPMKLRRVECP